MFADKHKGFVWNNKRSWLILAVLVFWSLCSVSSVSAQNAENNEAVRPTLLENDVKVCPEEAVTVSWPDTVKAGIQSRFILETSMPSNTIASVNHEIWEGETNITIYESATFAHIKETPGSYLIKTLVTTNLGCTYVHQKQVWVYNRVVTYIGPRSDEYQLAAQSFQSDEITLQEVVISTDGLQLEDTAWNLLANRAYTLQHTDVLLIDSQALWLFLSALPKLQETAGLTLIDQEVIVIASINQSAFRRLIATYHSIVGIKELSVIPRNNLGSLLSWLLLDKDPIASGIAKKFSIERTGQGRRLVLSSVVDSLLSNGLPLNRLLLILLVPVLVLTVTIFRQVVWFSTYWTFNALFIAFAIHMLGVQTVLVLLWIAFVVVRLVAWFTKKIYLLSGSRVALTIALYTVLIVAVMGFDVAYYNQTLMQTWWSGITSIFPIYYVLITWSSLFKDRGSIFSRKWWTKLFQYAVVLTVLVAFIRWNRLHNVLLWYPELIIIACLLIVLVGRFTWLQVTEYVRFMPLIAWSIREEEEEE